MRERLPASPSRLIGRERELAELRATLAEGARLLTLTGAGGSGKTALGLALAEGIADEFASSAFVDLSGLRDPSLVPQSIASAILAPRSAETPFESVARHIGAEPTLLLLDNFEQLLPEAAVVSDLLAACPALVVIATSRAPLELRWERVYQVGPLALPTEAPSPLAEQRRVASVALFVERARAVKPLFALDAENAAAVGAIVRRLDGLPLAIELAAARLRVLSVHEIAARVERALDLLTQSDADRPERQRTIRATIDWSVALLTDGQRRLLRRTGIFEGGAMIDAIEAVCSEPNDPSGLLEDLEDLVQAGIVMTSEVRGETRLRLPATVRERAIELLDESGETDAIAERHLRYMARVCTDMSVGEAAWHARIEIERENIRAALRYAFGPRVADRDPGMAIVYAMSIAWQAVGALEEAARWTDLALAVAPDSQYWSVVCCESAGWAHQSGDLAHAERKYRTALEIHRTQERTERVLFQTGELGRLARDRGDERTARAHYDEVLRRAREAGIEGSWRVHWELSAAECLRWFGHTGEARAQGERALALARRMDLVRLIALCLTTMGELARDRGEFRAAAALLDEAWELAARIGHRVSQRNIMTSQIRLACAAGEAARAVELAGHSLRVARTLGDRSVDTAAWIDALAFAASAMAQYDAAARLFASADALRESIGLAVPAVERQGRERALATVRAALGTRVPQRAAGDVSLTALFAFAERVFAPAQMPAVALSRREREVASLVARGLSNRAIAERLILGERTVETHVERVLRKLEVHSRHEVAARAEELALPL